MLFDAVAGERDERVGVAGYDVFERTGTFGQFPAEQPMPVESRGGERSQHVSR